MIKENFKKIFLPATLLSIFLAFSSSFLLLTQNALTTKLLVANQSAPRSVITKIALQIALVVILFLFARRKSFEKIFKGTLLSLIAIITLLTSLTLIQEIPAIQGLLEGIKNLFPQNIQPVITNWPQTLLYNSISALNLGLFSILVWGFLNRLTTPSTGIKYFIPLAFLLNLVTNIPSGLSLYLTTTINLPPYSTTLLAIFSMFCALITFSWAWKRLPSSLINPQEPKTSLRIRFPYLSSAFLITGSLMAKKLFDLIFKSNLKMQFASRADYMKFMTNYSMANGIALLSISIVWVVLGTWLVRKKGWKTTAKTGSLSLVTAGLIFLLLSAISHQPSWINQSTINGMLLGTSMALFFPLIQVLYLNIPYQSRLKTKIGVEMAAVPLLNGIPSLISMALITQLGTFLATVIYLKIAACALLLLLPLISWRLSSKFSI